MKKQWLGHQAQRAGAAILAWWDGDRYLGPTQASYHPRRTPWLFRGSNDQIVLVVTCLALLIWIWA